MKIKFRKLLPKKDAAFKIVMIIASIGLLMTTFLPILLSLK